MLAWCKPGVLIVTHGNADVDSVAAALALEHVLRSYTGSSFEVCFPEGLDAVSKKALLTLGFDIPRSRKCVGGRVVFVDVSSFAQARGVEFSECSFIDHHIVNTLVDSCGPYIYEPESGAASAILAEALMLTGFSIPRIYSTLLLAGIMHDTRFLRVLNPRLLKVVEWLLKSGADYDEIVRILTQQEVSYAERVARLKGLSRMGVYAVGEGYLMTVTCIGAYESSVLRYSVEAGSDVAIALATREDEARVTIRASSRLARGLKTPVAAELAKYIGERLGGSGGGHEAAAGAVIPKSSIMGLEELIIEFFSARGYKVRALDRGRWIEECA